MNIDLKRLQSKTVESIDISGNYNLDKSYYEGMDIISLADINVEGIIYLKDELEYIKCNIKGEMIIPDSITLEEISYQYNIEYDDYVPKTCIKNEFLLDIYAFLWENIVLEVPLHFTKVRDLSKFHGDGWKLVSEEELIKDNNPFNDLLKDL